jgi:hypothetical protein
LADKPGRIVAPNDGSSIDLTPQMWGALVQSFVDNHDYFESGTDEQQQLYKQLTEKGLIKTGQTSGR